MEKRVLVTGAAGFIGFHLAQALKARGDFVLGCDNFNDYYSPALKRDRAALLSGQDIEVFDVDICNGEKLRALVEQHRITHVAHLAAQAGVRYSLDNPHAYIRANVDGFAHILEIVKDRPGTKLVYASSSSVYGLNTKVPFSESDPVDHQASLYGCTKRSNELMANTYHHLYGIDAWGLRFFTVYGPWGRPDMAYFSFSKAILAGRPIKVFNNGNMERDFTYIDDIISGVLAALDRCAGCEVFNLGNEHPEPLMKMITCLERLHGREAEKNFVSMQAGDVERTYADLEKSRRMLGFSPKTSLDEGLAKFVDWYKSYQARLSQTVS